MAATGLDSKPDMRKIAWLLTVTGAQAIKFFNTFKFDVKDDWDKLDKVLEKFDTCCSLQKNVTYERYIFHSCIQQQNNIFDNFMTDLKLKAQVCDLIWKFHGMWPNCVWNL